MSQTYRPQGYNAVSPYLVVDDAEQTIAFLIRAFDATELRRMPNSLGKIMHAEVRIDDTIVMLADSSEGWPSIPANVHVYVADVDATYRRALESGAVAVQEPKQTGDEDRRGGVKDAGGTTWWIATRIG